MARLGIVEKLAIGIWIICGTAYCAEDGSFGGEGVGDGFRGFGVETYRFDGVMEAVLYLGTGVTASSSGSSSESSI